MSEHLRSQIAGWCRHFNGISNETCEAGVNYLSVRDAGQGFGANFPCFRDSTLECPLREWYTDAEVEARVKATNDAIRAFTDALEANKCPHCGADVKRKKQVGRCVYAQPCGHRLYQGSV